MISCVIPVHNRGALLCEAIESVVEQDIAGTQLIVVDDASTEDLESIVQSFTDSSVLEIVYRRLPKGGANAARAYGQAQATKPFVQFLDSDDMLLPRKWRSQLRHFAERPGLDVSVSATFVDQDGLHKQHDPGYPRCTITATSFALHRTAFKIAAPLWRRESLLRVAEWPPDLTSSQDWETHLRAILCGLSFEYCGGGGFLIRSAASHRIADSPTHAKAAGKILAMYLALDAAHRLGSQASVVVRAALLGVATRMLISFLRRRPCQPDRSGIEAYARLLSECLRSPAQTSAATVRR